jgi:DNA polymerase-3 subunit alpha
LFSEAFFENRELLQSDQVIVVEGQVSHDDYSGQMKMRVSSVMDVGTARQQFSRGLKLAIHADQLQNGLLDKLDSTLRPFRCEGSPVWIEYSSDNASTRIELGESWRVQPDDDLLLELKYLVGDQSVELVYD